MKLRQGERIVWEGKPAGGLRFYPQDIFMVPFSLLWLGLVIFIFASAPLPPGPAPDPFWIILPLFLAIGFYMAFGRFVTDIFIRRRMSYTLTNRRALIRSGLFREGLRTVNLAVVPEIDLRMMRGGRGTIQFGSGSPFSFMMSPSWPGAGRYRSPSFDLIEDAERVFALAQDAQEDDSR